MIIVEDGSIVSGAEAYCTVSYANTYHANRGNTAWDALDDGDDKEPALRKATDYITQMFRSRWKGCRADTTQSLCWPRSGVLVDGTILIDSDVIPIEIMNACAELALRASTANLYADTAQQKKRVKIGPIETEYDSYSPQSTQYPAIVAMLRPYLTGGGGVTLVRA